MLISIFSGEVSFQGKNSVKIPVPFKKTKNELVNCGLKGEVAERPSKNKILKSTKTTDTTMQRKHPVIH